MRVPGKHRPPLSPQVAHLCGNSSRGPRLGSPEGEYADEMFTSLEGKPALEGGHRRGDKVLRPSDGGKAASEDPL